MLLTELTDDQKILRELIFFEEEAKICYEKMSRI